VWQREPTAPPIELGSKRMGVQVDGKNYNVAQRARMGKECTDREGPPGLDGQLYENEMPLGPAGMQKKGRAA
jgi:hypothetical protein